MVLLDIEELDAGGLWLILNSFSSKVNLGVGPADVVAEDGEVRGFRQLMHVEPASICLATSGVVNSIFTGFIIRPL